jgi:hypothetical protein
MLLKQTRRDDQVQCSSFVFRGDEEKSLGSDRALADDYDPRF